MVDIYSNLSWVSDRLYIVTNLRLVIAEKEGAITNLRLVFNRQTLISG